MARFSFCGATYSSESPNSDSQRSVNLYPETNESGQGNSAVIMRRSPGLSIFSTLPEGPVRGEFEFNGRFFAVGGSRFCEVLAGGKVINLAAVGNDGLPVTMQANQAGQLLLASAGTIYLFNLLTNVLTQPATAPTNISIVEFSDSFFLALTKNANQFQLSNSLDGNTWNGINVSKAEVFPENIVSMIVDHREVALLGNKHSAIYFDSGGEFPYDVVPGGFIEQGCAAVYGRSRLDNSTFWLGMDERGQGIAWRNNGYTPQRISNHAIEGVWAKYPRISDAVSYAFQRGGHSIWHIYFPSGLNDSGLPLGASWRYDAATQMWHEVSFWDAVNGRYTAHRSQCHAFAFGMNLVGDWNSANIYQMDEAILSDFGNPIRRMRRAPHVSTEQEKMFHSKLQLHVETGLGPQPPLLGPDFAPAKAPSFITLEDANGVLWTVKIDDAGNFTRIAGSPGVAQTIILNDSGMIPRSAWQLGITIAGNLITTLVASANALILLDPNDLRWAVWIDDDGNINQTQEDSGGGFGVSFGVSFGDDGGTGSSSPAQIVRLNDSGLTPSTSWLIGIDAFGDLTADPIPFSPSYPQTFAMASVPGNRLTGLSVTVDGLIQTGGPGFTKGNPFLLNYPQIYPLMSTPGNHLTGILVTADGLLQTNKPNQARDPQVCLRWSDDGGHSWSQEHWRGAGQAGKFKTRMIWRRLGWSWDRVYEVSMSDPVAWTIIDAYLEATPGFQPTERLVHQLRKGA